MGGKSSQSTQTVSIPPEILARYNAVNARAEETAKTPFQQYSTNPADFVAPLTETQQAGIANTNYYAGTAQPYYQAATGQLAAAQQAATPYYGQATNAVSQGQGVGNQYASAATQALAGGQNMGYGLAGQALGGMNAAYQGAQPFNQAAAGYMIGGSQAVNPNALGAEQIGQYMSPYLGTVLQGTAGLQNQMNQQAMAGQLGNAIRQGAFGGDRAGIAAANLAQQQQLANSKIFSDILNQGYGQALGTAQQQQQLGLSAEQANRQALQQAAQQALGIGQQQYGQGMGTAQAQAALGQQLFGQGATTAQQLAALGQQQFGQNLASSQQMQALGQGLYGMGANTAQQLAALGQGAQGAGLQGAQAQLAAGQAQQQTDQAARQAMYNQFLQMQSYPFQTAQFLANIAMGTGALSGSTTQTNQAQGGFSDRRLKENIREVGKTFDGQTIYSYNFKGSPKTEIGLMAQEVEKKHPEAVGLAGGYKTVRYDKATDDAADRGHFAYGGSAMGGGVMPQHAGEGFYDGGYVGGFDPGLMQQILSSYQQMYAPFAGGQNAGGLGAASFVPAGNLPVGSLQTAGELPAMRNPMENAANMVSIGKNIGEIGGKLHAWDWGDDKKAEKETDREDPTDRFSGIYRNGGLAGYADGGMPYDDTKKLDIPNEKEKIEPLKPADAPQPIKDNTMSTIMDAAKIAMMFAKNGGRIGYAAGGTPYGNDGGYLSGVLDEQNKQKAPELMKPGSLPGQGPGFLDKASKGVGIVSGLMNIGSKLGIGFADGGLAGADRMGDAQEPDFNLDPEDLIAGEDQQFEALLRSAPQKKAAQPQMGGLGALQQSTQDFANKIAYKPEPMGAGLAPAMAPKAMPTLGGSGVRSVRNNNPGNIEDGSFAKSLPGYAGSDGRFAIFENPMVGRAAQLRLIRSYINRGYDTPWKIASRWAPAKEKGNNVESYAKKIAQMSGVGIHDRVSTSAIPQIANAQTIVEGGQKALQHFLPGKAEGGLIGRHGYAEDGFVEAEKKDENKATGLAPETPVAAPAPAPTPKPEEPSEILVNAKREKPKALLPELPQRGISYGQGTEQKPAYFGGSTIPGYRYDYMTEPFFKGLKKGTASSWIPLLTGLGTFATTPSRSLLSGLLAGAGAGAQTYATMANERNKQLPTRQAAEARYAEATQGFVDKNFVPLGGGRYYYVPARRVLNQDEYAAMRRQMTTNLPGFFPEVPETAKPYTAADAIIKPPTAKPVSMNIQPDMSTPVGILAAAYVNPVVADLRQKITNYRSQMNDLNVYGREPDVMANPQAQQSIGLQLQGLQTQLTDATQQYDKTLEKLTGTSLATLGETQRAAFNNTMERAANLTAEQQSLRPIMLAFASLKGNYGGGTAQGTWARIADFAKNFLGLSQEGAAALAQGADANARLQVLQNFFPGAAGVFDPNNPGPALEAIYKDYLTPRYQDIGNQLKTLNTSPTGAPSSSVGVNPPLPSPTPEKPSSRSVKGRDGIWRGASVDDVKNNPNIRKGERYRVPDGKGGWIEGIKQ